MPHKRSKDGQARQALRKLSYQQASESYSQQLVRLMNEHRDKHPIKFTNSAQRTPPSPSDQRRGIITSYSFHDAVNGDIVYTQRTFGIVMSQLRLQFGVDVEAPDNEFGEVLNRFVDKPLVEAVITFTGGP